MTVRVVSFAATAPSVALMFADPILSVVASQGGDANDATLASFDAQVTDGVTSFDAPSENVPVAWNWTSTPSGTDGASGSKARGERAEAVTAIAWSVAFVTVRVTVASWPLAAWNALIVEDWPTEGSARITPGLATSFETVNALTLEELQATSPVTSAVVASVSVAIAVSCSERPIGSSPVAGVTAIETTSAGVTRRATESVEPEHDAVIVVCPRPSAVAIPPETLATAGSDEVHCPVAVQSSRRPSCASWAWN